MKLSFLRLFLPSRDQPALSPNLGNSCVVIASAASAISNGSPKD